ncbi:MAG: CheR family methyltransferase [Burkholderiaceae bacterium]
MGAPDQSKDLLARATAADSLSREYSFSSHDFDRVRRLIRARAGIDLNASKQNMVYSRLARRVRATGRASFAEYLDDIESDATSVSAEAQQFVNALTTNLTAFFRESHHFPLLAEFLRGRSKARLWCAAASTGEEPWSIAMTAAEALTAGSKPSLIATDIDTNVLATAAQAVYSIDSAQACGDARLRRWFLRGKGDRDGLVRVKPELAGLVQYRPLNLLDPTWPRARDMAEGFDAVFCRNVLIYFDHATQREVLGRIAEVLRPGGLLFVGHSENFSDCRSQFRLRGKTVYERLP